jgi:hypothetical protein
MLSCHRHQPARNEHHRRACATVVVVHLCFCKFACGPGVRDLGGDGIEASAESDMLRAEFVVLAANCAQLQQRVLRAYVQRRMSKTEATTIQVVETSSWWTRVEVASVSRAGVSESKWQKHTPWAPHVLSCMCSLPTSECRALTRVSSSTMRFCMSCFCCEPSHVRQRYDIRRARASAPAGRARAKRRGQPRATRRARSGPAAARPRPCERCRAR